MAYAWILLSTYGGYPCVFYGDLFGVNGPDKPRGPACPGLPLLMRARTTLAHGPQRARLDDPTCVGFTREGLKTEHDASGVAAIMCTGMRPQQKRMFVGRHHASEIWAHVLGTDESVVQIDEDGCGLFTAPTRGLGVYAEQTMALCLRRGQP